MTAPLGSRHCLSSFNASLKACYTLTRLEAVACVPLHLPGVWTVSDSYNHSSKKGNEREGGSL